MLGKWVTYKSVYNRDCVGLVYEKSSRYTVEVAWWEPERVNMSEVTDNLLILDDDDQVSFNNKYFPKVTIAQD